jgi:hypothetical protein
MAQRDLQAEAAIIIVRYGRDAESRTLAEIARAKAQGDNERAEELQALLNVVEQLRASVPPSSHIQ